MDIQLCWREIVYLCLIALGKLEIVELRKLVVRCTIVQVDKGFDINLVTLVIDHSFIVHLRPTCRPVYCDDGTFEILSRTCRMDPAYHFRSGLAGRHRLSLV